MIRSLTALLVAGLACAQAADITLAVPSTAQSLGSTFTLAVEVANAGPFANWGTLVTFDTTKVQLTAQATGTFATCVQDSRGLAAINAAGEVRMGGFSLADNAGGNGTLAVLTFQTIGVGSAAFATAAKSVAAPFGCVLTRAAGGESLPTIPAASTVTITGTTPVPTSPPPVMPISSSGQAAALAAGSDGGSSDKVLGCGLGNGLGLIVGACALLMLSLRRRRG